MKTRVDIKLEPTILRFLPSTKLLYLRDMMLSLLQILSRIPLVPNLFCLKTKISTRFRDIIPNSIITVVPQDPNYRSKQSSLHFVFA
jgi:hypothetical protein